MTESRLGGTRRAARVWKVAMWRPGLVLVFVGFALVTGAACSGSDSADPGDDPPPASEIFAHASEAMMRDGFVYHVLLETEFSVGSGKKDRQKDEIWADVARDVAHLRTNVDPPQGEISSEGVMAGGVMLGGRPAPTCHGANAVVSLVLRCDESEVVISTTVRRGRFDGRSTVIVATKGERSPGDGTLYYTRDLHIDAATWLPIGEETEGVWGPLAPVKFTKVVRFTSEFVAADSLPATFFDPGDDRSVGENLNIIELVVLPGGRFEQTAVKVKEYQTVTYRLVNRDTGVAHNLALYPVGGDAASRMARTGSCEGPCERVLGSLEIHPGPRSVFEFRCDLHPDKMKATLEFEANSVTVPPSATNTPVPLLAGPNSIRNASTIAISAVEVRYRFDYTYAIDPPGGTITAITMSPITVDGRPLKSYQPSPMPVSRGDGGQGGGFSMLAEDLASITGFSICFTGPGQPDLGCTQVSLQRP